MKKNTAEFLIIFSILLLVVIIVIFLVYEINKFSSNPQPTSLKWKCMGNSCVYGFFDGFISENDCKTNCIGPCSNINCMNGGYCENGSCVCTNGYTGKNCEISPNNCININCGKYGVCSNGLCICTNGYTGKNCENPPNPNIPPMLPNGIDNMSPVEKLDGISGNVYLLPDNRYVSWLNRLLYPKGIIENNGGDYICKFENDNIPGINHASSMILLSNDRILMVWFSGVCEGYNRVSIVYSILDKFNWSYPKIIPGNTRNGFSNQNPVLAYLNGEINLFYTSQPNQCDGDNLGIREAYATIFRQKYINDEWTFPKQILGEYSNNGIFIKNKVVILNDNSWVIPGYIFRNHDIGYQFSTFWNTNDNGETYTQTINTNMYMMVQPSVVYFNGKYYAFMRDRGKKWINYSISNNLKNWSKISPTNIPNNDSSIQAMVYKYDNSLLLALNPNNGSNRHNLSLFKCNSNKDPIDINSYTKTIIDSNNVSGFSYPWIVEDSKNNIHISYTFQQVQGVKVNMSDMKYYIKYQFLSRDWIINNM